MSWSISPWSPSWVKTAQRSGLPGQKTTQNTIAVPVHHCGLLSLPIPMQPNLEPVPQEASLLVSRWGLQMLWQYSQTRNQATLRGVENSDFIFMPVGSDVYLCLSTEQRIYRIFKRQCKASGYKECALPSINGLET
jgi:hypothetical protein